MRINKLQLRQFRTYAAAEAEFSPQMNVICGANGEGKTNLLEGVYLLSGQRSWRTVRRAELLRFGESRGKLLGQVTARGREFDISLSLSLQGRRQDTLNGVPVHSRYELAEVARCVLFCPEDLQLARGSAAVRRAFLDQCLCQLRPRYSEVLSAYGHALAQKQRVLRVCEEQPGALEVLPELNAYLARCGASILRYRANLIESLAGAAAAEYAACSGGREQLALRYRCDSAVPDPAAPREQIERQLLEHMELRRPAEIGSRACLVGVHRDDLELELDGRSARSFASQGQARSAAIALRLAQTELFYRDAGEYPLLLLDDVLSELDAERQHFVLARAGGCQTLITCAAPPENLPPARLLRVERGTVRCERE